MLRGLWISCLLLASAARANPVTEWTRLADEMGHGGANWRTLAIMHQAMHDAVNAAEPRYARWFPPAPGEPAGPADPRAAAAAAARRVLVRLHPADAAEADRLLRQAYARIPDTPAARRGLDLGDAVADAAVARRQDDGYLRRHRFAQSQTPGRWRSTPQEFEVGGTTETQPFLFRLPSDDAPEPPPPPGSAAFAADLARSSRLGADLAPARTAEQGRAAHFWAYQSSQRGFVALGARLLDADPAQGSLAEHARIMSILTAAMADSAIMTWREKEQFSRWRPVTAIRALMPGEASWLPLIETPGHPEYPSGHAADCFTGALVLQALLPDLRGPIAYVMQSGHLTTDEVGMGQHDQGTEDGNAPVRRFASLADAAAECADSRIWSGAHFPSANAESRRLAGEIARRAVAAVPPLPH